MRRRPVAYPTCHLSFDGWRPPNRVEVQPTMKPLLNGEEGKRQQQPREEMMVWLARSGGLEYLLKRRALGRSGSAMASSDRSTGALANEGPQR